MTVAAIQMNLFAPPIAMTSVAPSSIPYRDPFVAAHAETLARAGKDRLSFDETSWDRATRTAVGVDVECFVNAFVVCFKRFTDGKRLAFERSNRSELDRDAIAAILRSNVIISFNGTTYDLPMICLALAGADPVKLKQASDEIIFGNAKAWEIETRLGVKVPRLNHVDLIETNPSVRQGLKMIAARLHSRFVVDLPCDPAAHLTPEEMNLVTLYCQYGDLDATELLYRSLREPLELRVALGQRYKIDLRSKSDSQIGETIVKRRIEAPSGRRIERRGPAAASFGYEVPAFVRFESPILRGVVERLSTARFSVSGGEKIAAPDFLRDLTIPIGDMKYSMGIGGLHSTEAHRAIIADDNRMLIDVDVASQYPRIIMTLGLYPAALGPAFLKIYDALITERLAAKAAGDKVKAEGSKIALNGVFGKLGSPYSPLYSPNLMIAVTLTGQLAILMMIERTEAAGIRVVSANTDGVVFYCDRSLEPVLDELIRTWEKETGFSVERTPYRALYNASVNTYVAIRTDGRVKRKGYLSDPWTEGDLREQMKKNPQMTIASEAIVRYLIDGRQIQETINACRDLRMFVTVIKVTGGARWRGHSLGRIVRYYWSLDGDVIHYADGSRKVAKTEGARPLPELTSELPPDLDRDRYVEEAYRIAVDLGIPGF